MIQSFKMVNNIKGNNIGLFDLKNSNTRSHRLAVKIKSVNSNLKRNFFSVRVPHIWNILPQEIIESECVMGFKNSLDRFYFEKNLLYNPELDFQNTTNLSRIIKS